MEVQVLGFCALLWDTHYRTGFQARMSQLDEAVARYNKLLEGGPFHEVSWAEELHARMEREKLSSGGRLICPFLRPHFITRRQYESLVKTGEALICAIDRMEQMVLANPALLARLELRSEEHTSELQSRFGF